jgi:hypothetical protein
LDVSGNVTITRPAATALSIRGATLSNYASFDIGRTVAEASFSVPHASGQFANNSVAGDLVIRTESTSAKILFTNAATNSTLAVAGNNVLVGTISSTGTASQPLQVSGGAYVSGNLGIGIINPSQTLDVQSTSGGTTLRLRNSSGNFIDFFETSGLTRQGYIGYVSINDLYINNNRATGAIRFGVNDTEKVRIDSAGNVLVGSATSTGTASQPLQVTGGAYVSGNLGIGVANPVYKLNVQDTIAITNNASNISNLIFPVNGSASYNTWITADGRTSGYLAINTNNAERLRINSSGNIGIGTNNPSTKLSVNGTITESTDGTNYWPVVTQQDIGTAPNQVPINGYLGSLAFEDSDSVNIGLLNVTGNLGIGSTTPARKLDVVDSGASGSVIRSRVTTNNGGYLAYEALNSSGTSVFSVTHNGRINLSENVVFASGQGLDFSATANSSGTMTSELLSDYEEGTFTPGISFGGGSVGITYTTQSGGYIKVGNQVTVWIFILLSNKGSSTGESRITGLPFTNVNSLGRSEGATFISNYWSNFASAIIPIGYVQNNASTIFLTNGIAATAVSTIPNTTFANNTAIYGCATYSVV